MPTTPTPAEALHAELALLRQEDENRAARIRRIEALQMPIMIDALLSMDTKPLAEALTDLTEAQSNLTDQRQAAVANLVAHLSYARQHLAQEVERIQAQIDADAEVEA